MKKVISIVIPAFNEADCIDELALRLQGVFELETDYEFECIIVENGSTDKTFSMLMNVHQKDGRFKILQLARNFRMDGGLTAGLDYATGDACVLMTADLQDPPELIHEFLRHWEQGYENIFGIVTKREGTGPIRRFNSRLFYLLAHSLTNGRVTRNASDFRLVDRKVYEVVRQMDERNRFVRGLFSWVGFKSIGVPMVRPPRFGGVSKAHTFKVIDLALKGIFAHSYTPLRFISLFGLMVSVGSLVATTWFAALAIFTGVPFPGFGTLLSVLLLGIGVISLILGVIGEYVALIYEEVKRRPNYVVSKKVGLLVSKDR
jgi:dolichol-phosphate mannosyltransferase